MGNARRTSDIGLETHIQDIVADLLPETWEVFEMIADHLPYDSKPEELLEILLRIL